MSREIRFPAAAVAALARGERIEAIRRVREANHGVDLRGAMEAVDAHASGKHRFPVDAHEPAAAAPLDGLPAEAVAAVSRGQLIEAIKIVRQATGLGLKEAKDLVDAYRENPARVPDSQLDDKLDEVARRHGVELPPAAIDALNRGNVVEAIKLVRQASQIGLQEARDAVRDHAGGAVPRAARKASTVSVETNRHGWLWALVLLGCFAAAWFWLGR